jgi:lysophospholipase L1-like esterase
MTRRSLSILVSVTVATALLATPAAASANSGRSECTTYYLALGDSLAFGYQPVRPLDRTQGYVYQLHAALAEDNRKLRLENLGCSGETTATLLGGGICSYPGADSQLAAAERFLRAHKNRVSLVTLDIGANDVQRCARDATIDTACVVAGLQAITTNLTQIVQRLRSLAPHVQLVAMNYYDPFLAAWLTGPAGQELARLSVVFNHSLNGLESAIYTVAGIPVADVAGAFSTDDFTTQVPLPNGVSVPLNVARICQWTWMCAPAPLGPDIHANKQGYAVIADAFLDVVDENAV